MAEAIEALPPPPRDPTSTCLCAAYLFADVWKREHEAMEDFLKKESEALVAFICDLKYWDAERRVMTDLWWYKRQCQTWSMRHALETRVCQLLPSDKYYLEFYLLGDRQVQISIKEDK
jgi:hypothetical protein